MLPHKRDSVKLDRTDHLKNLNVNELKDVSKSVQNLKTKAKQNLYKNFRSSLSQEWQQLVQLWAASRL